MSGVLDLLSWFLPDDPSSANELDPDDKQVVELVDHARGETVTPESLTNQHDRTNRPLFEYLREDEQPEYVFRGGEILLEDETETLGRKHPTGETKLIISDRRFLIVVGGRLSDDVWEVPLEDVVDVYVNSSGIRRHLVLEGNTDANPMTFFVDVSIESNTAELKASVEYVARYVD